MAQTKVRGRRAEKKEKAQAEQIEQSEPTVPVDSVAIPNTFFGLVDSNELDYFKQAESTLNINAFDDDDERAGFINSVFEESKGKELKLVTNQICSKLMERLILFSTDEQLKQLFHSFLTHFSSLSFNKYSSHVLETLLVRSAALIEREMSIELTELEELFIKMVHEFNPVTMINHQYASHVLRVVLLVLSGKELPSSTISNSILRSKKSKIARKMIEIKDNQDFNNSYQTPTSFKSQLRELITSISSTLDMKRTRELCIDKVASPVLQLLVQVEGLVDRERTIWHLIFCKDNVASDTTESAFVEYLLSDAVGSHFLEAVVKQDGVRLKYIERIYKLYIKDRVLKLANRSTTGVYIIQALLFKLKPVEVEYILDEIIPELSKLIDVSQTQNLDLAQRLIDASISRGNYRQQEIIDQLFLKFAPNYNEHSEVSTEFLENVLQLTGSTLGNTRGDWPTAEERRRSLFLEKLLQYDYKFITCIWLNFMALPQDKFIQMCTHGVFSHVVEHSLVVQPEEPKPTLILRKRLLNIFQGHAVELSCNSYGSHIMDALWKFTVLLPMYKDRIAIELMNQDKKVKESTYGRLVWKNWGMELFVRKKYDWKSLIKQQQDEYYGGDEGVKVKKPIELKMEQLAEEKKRKQELAEQAEAGYNKRKLDQEFGDEKRVKVRGRRR
ncbi:Nucleolar protein [Spathaspora sp. JA1]|nr:Nucleolar protein [Spathaspora sp. JA1]